MSSEDTSTLRTFGSVAVPALPGATSTSVTRAACAHFHARACSRPPEPTIKTFRVAKHDVAACGAFEREGECLKCRMPVNTIAMPCSSAAAMTSSSRFEPPGWITALMPNSAATSNPSRKGKNASDAITAPATCSFSSAAFNAATRLEYTRLICPAPTPMVVRPRA